MNVPHREILWNVPPAVMTAVYVLSALALAWIAAWLLRRSLRWRQGAAAAALPWRSGLARLAGYLLTHRTIARDRYAGLMHALIFWGFLILLLATALVAAACGGTDDNSGGTGGGTQLSGNIVIDGSSTVAPITEAIAEEFRKEQSGVQATVGTSGTGGGFTKFCNGETDISDASRAIND